VGRSDTGVSRDPCAKEWLDRVVWAVRPPCNRMTMPVTLGEEFARKLDPLRGAGRGRDRLQADRWAREIEGAPTTKN
jgi:hypothetical protein